MVKRVLAPLAPGCEELEAVTIIDLLRRARIEVTVAGIVEGAITASRGVRLLPDTTLDQVCNQDFDMIVLPGGLPGSDHLADDPRIGALLKKMDESGKFVAAVCAAPKVLARHGLLENRQATAYPGVLHAEKHPYISGQAVTRDGHIITARSVGTVMDFTLELITALCGSAVRESVESAMERFDRS